MWYALVGNDDWEWKKKKNGTRWKSYFSGWFRDRKMLEKKQEKLGTWEEIDMLKGKVKEVRKDVRVKPKNKVEGGRTGQIKWC